MSTAPLQDRLLWRSPPRTIKGRPGTLDPRKDMAPRGRPAPPGSPPEPLGPRFSNSPPPKTLTPASHPRRPPFSHLASSKGGIHVHTSIQYVRPRPVSGNRCEPVAVAKWPRRPVCFAPLRPPEPARAPRPRGQRPRRRRLPASGREGRFGQTCSATSLWWDCIHGPGNCHSTWSPAPRLTARPGQVPPAERSGVTHGQRAQSLAGRCWRVPDQHGHSQVVAVRSRCAGTSPEPVPATLGPDGALGSPSMPPEVVVTRTTHHDDSIRRSTQVVL